MKAQYRRYQQGFQLPKPPPPSEPRWLWRGLYRVVTRPTELSRRKRSWVPWRLYSWVLRHHLPAHWLIVQRMARYRNVDDQQARGASLLL